MTTILRNGAVVTLRSLAQLSVLVLILFSAQQSYAQVCNDMSFSNVTQSAGITHLYSRPSTPEGVMSGGAVAEDFNNDGWLDLYVVQGSGGPNLLYINDQQGGFVDEAAARSADLEVASVAASAADFDNDGDIDIGVSVAEDQFRILVNDGSGNFTSEIVLPQALRATMGSSWGDVNNDGLLELAVGQWNEGEQSFFLFRNDGGTILTEYEFRTVPRDDIYVFSPRFADLNGDRLADLHVVSDFTNSQLYMNVGGGSFQNVTVVNGTGGAAGGQNEMGHAIADYDNDSDLDIFTSNISTDGGNRLYQNNGAGVFSQVQGPAGVLDGNWGWGASFGDFDNDSDLDLYHVNGWHTGATFIGQPSRLFMNDGSGVFSEVANCAGADDLGQGKGMLQFDYDNDGDLDIFIVNSMDVPAVGQEFPAAPVLLRNDTANGNGWLKVSLSGAPPLHRNGIGSRVYARIGATTMMHEMHASTNFLSQNAGRIAHFGIGTVTTVDEVTAEWLNGDATVIPNVGGNQHVLVPSPVSTVSARDVELNEVVTAEASAESLPVDWTIEGVTYADPVAISFNTVGEKDLTLNVYDASGTNVVRQEILRISVQSPEIVSPVPGSILTADTVTFDWTANSTNVTDWRLQVGTAVGDDSIHDSGTLVATELSDTVNGLPVDGSTVFVRLSYTIDSVSGFSDYTYIANDENAGPAITNPVPGSTLSGSTVTFDLTDNSGEATFWQLQLGSAPGGSDLGDTGVLDIAVTSTTLAGLPTDGTQVYATLYWVVGQVGIDPTQSTSFEYTAADIVSADPTISSPVAGSTLSGASQNFVFADNGSGTTFWQLWLGSTAGASDLGDSGILGAATTSTTMNGLPTDGSTVFATLYWVVGQVGVDPTQSSSFTYTAFSTVGSPAMSAPAPGSTLSSDSETFSWTANGAAVADWRLQVGTAPGDDSLYDSGTLAAGVLSQLVTGLPTDGSSVNVRLSYTISSVTSFIDYTYTATTVIADPEISNPAPGSVLAGSSVDFDFADNGSGATFWQLWLGSAANQNDLGDTGVLDSATTSATVDGLPTDGSTVFATLYWVVGTVGVDPTQSISFTYTAADIVVLDPEIANPAPGSTLAGDTATFYLSENGAGVTNWQIWLGSTPGGSDLADSGIIGIESLNTTLSGLPADGSTVYATLYWITGELGQSPVQSVEYTYVSGPSLEDDTDPSVARQWSDVLLEGIRGDFARPTVHARNLWHISSAMYDAWSVYDPVSATYLLGNTVDGFFCEYTDEVAGADVHQSREEAISYAAYRLIHHRFATSPGAAETLASADDLMASLGYDTSVVSADTTDGTPAKLGNRIAQCYIDFGQQDGSNEVNDYGNNFYSPVNAAIEPFEPGNPNIVDLNRWQPIALPIAIDQSGNPILSEPEFLSPEWGQVSSFALSPADLTVNQRDGFDYNVYHDPGAPPTIDGTYSNEYKWGFEMVAVWSSHLDPASGVMVDISPGNFGNIDVTTYPTDYTQYDQFYNFFDGGDVGTGHTLNPVTGLAVRAERRPTWRLRPSPGGVLG